MDGPDFDRMSKRFAQRRFSRRRGVVQATPAPTPTADHGPTMLFVQTFQAGSITPKEGVEGRYTLTLEAGTGQTIYFSDRPDRIAGASPTPQFLAGLGFPPDNPPNAALVVETAPGETDVAVVELFAPLYDPVSQGVTYEVEALENWEASLELGLSEAPTDLAVLAPGFGAAHLFIDDCPDGTLYCVPDECDVGFIKLGGPYCSVFGTIENSAHDGFCYSWLGAACLPCQPWFQYCREAREYWSNQCNERIPACQGNCKTYHTATYGPGACW